MDAINAPPAVVAIDSLAAPATAEVLPAAAAIDSSGALPAEDGSAAPACAERVDVLVAPASGDAPPPQTAPRECPVCLSSRDDLVVLTCAHAFCADCLTAWVVAGPVDPSCPSCRAPIQPDHPGLRAGQTARTAASRAAAAAAAMAKRRADYIFAGLAVTLIISLTIGLSLTRD